MQVKKTDNVIFLKNLESNIIKEAFIILKDNVNLERIGKDSDIPKGNKKINILKEAELLINEEIAKNNLNYQKYKIVKLENKLKILKVFSILNLISFITYIIIIK